MTHLQERQHVHVNSKRNMAKNCLFKLNGVMILNKPVKVKRKSKPWTIGRYLLLTKKSSYIAKLGIGYADTLQSVSWQMVKESCTEIYKTSNKE